MAKIIFECLFYSILLIALELLFIWIILLIRDWATDSSFEEEEKEDEEDECEHEWQFVGFDNSKLSIGILQCIYQCKKCGKVISI